MSARDASAMTLATMRATIAERTTERDAARAHLSALRAIVAPFVDASEAGQAADMDAGKVLAQVVETLAGQSVVTATAAVDALAMFVRAVDNWQDDGQPMDASDFIALIETTAENARSVIEATLTNGGHHA